MKKLLNIFFGLLIVNSWSQIEIAPQTINSSGGIFQSSGDVWQNSIGEVFTSTIESDQVIITNGFIFKCV